MKIHAIGVFGYVNTEIKSDRKTVMPPSPYPP